jgi:hypothetical protein
MLKKVPCLIVIKPTVCDILQMDFFQRLENILLLLAGLVICKIFLQPKKYFHPLEENKIGIKSCLWVIIITTNIKITTFKS